ncbi:RCC1-like G exchanging factor-like protein [Chelonus insularis]|uniref:RCC1-like G exchanging factor-like protein n=1 Tax=Chelonus insularis TaxID=460826 RepID=UPI00158B028E|nr:RCC1-like G exchanging factor-like protein [Chelonus insularis]
MMIGPIRTYTKLAARKIKKIRPPSMIKKPRKSQLEPKPIVQYPVSGPDDRRLYSWGLANHGALGTIGRTTKYEDYNFITKPRRLYFGEHHHVRDIACGYGFTLVGVHSKDTDIVYGCGINTDSQLGYDDNDKIFNQIKDEIIPILRSIPLPIKSNSTKVLGLAAGRAHSIILTSEGVFTLGNNGYGQCGRVIIGNENYYRSRVVNHIKDIKGAKITAVAAGQDHSIFLTENGQVYTCGWGADGQTGQGHYENRWKPDLVIGDLAEDKISKITCTGDCVLALSESGKIYGWGNSEYGQLPNRGDDNFQINTAIELSDCAKLGKIIDIAAGGSFCMLLTESGDVYTWGHGILGFGPQVTRVSTPTLIPNTLFGRNPYQTDIKITKIFCGMNHMAAITNHGDLYTWGRNTYGFLGLGHYKDQFFPFKVAVGAEVKKVACGVDHTFAICKPYI